MLAPVIALTMSTALAVLLAAAPLTELTEAVKSGDRAAVVRLLDKRADVNTPEPDGTTALHWAAQRNDRELVERLIRAGANAKVRNDYGATPMSEAAVYGNAAILELLLKAGADADSPNSDGQTALMLVARTSNVEAARLLVKHGARVNAAEQWHGQTALMWAAAQSQPGMVSALIAAGADVNARSNANQFSRQVSAEPRALGRPVGGLTPLLFAAREGCVACVRSLVDAGADVEMADPEEITPLLIALLNARFDAASALLDKGANIRKWDWYGRTPLYVAVDMNTMPRGGRPDGPVLDTTTSLQIIERLLTNGANPNSQLKLVPPLRHIVDDRTLDTALTIGATPLLRAAKAFDAPAVALLLKHGANVSLPNMRGQTPVMVAAGLAALDADSRGIFTTEDVEQRSIATLKLLIAAGADVNGKDGTRGMTAVHEAARWGWNDVITFLVANGANVHVTDNTGMTPLDSSLGRAGGNSKFAARKDVWEDTATLLRGMGVKEGTPVAGAGGAGAGRGAGGGGRGGAGRGAGPGGGPGAVPGAGAPPTVAVPPPAPAR